MPASRRTELVAWRLASRLLAISNHRWTQLLFLAICPLILLFGMRCWGANDEQRPNENRPPNIVLIVADDLGINDLSCYGRKDHRTPALDSLASQGVRFTTCYCAQPICSPSRAAIMTGKHPARLQLTTYLPGRPDAASQKVLHPLIEPELNPMEQTIAEVLRREGYATGMFGKWHLGRGDSSPSEQGFQNVSEPHELADPESRSGGKNEFLIASQAIEFIAANQDRPFFCYVPHHSPHVRLQAPKRLLESNREAWNPLYAATVESLDASIGKLLAAIEASPENDNTIVIFTSDNGGLHVPEGHSTPATYNAPFRAGKGYLYEGGVRVPLLIRWPRRIKTGLTQETPVSLLDLLPTLLEACGIETMKSVGPVDGQNMMSLCLEQVDTPATSERAFFWHFPHYTNQGSRPASAIRRGDWKVIEHLDEAPVELFNLARDPGEKSNVADQNQALVNELRETLSRWRISVAAQQVAPNPNLNQALFSELYIHRDASRLDGSQQTAEQIADQWLQWRSSMNDAVAGKQPKLKARERSVRLLASQATPHGTKLRYEPETYKNVLGYWTEVDDWAHWNFDITEAGEYAIEVHCGCGTGNGGSQVEVIVTDASNHRVLLEWTVRETGHFQNIVIENIGKISLDKGTHRLEVRPKSKKAAAVVDIREIALIP